jgi:hypothetical protein
MRLSIMAELTTIFRHLQRRFPAIAADAPP